MQVGYVYGFDSYSLNNGGAIHAHNLICHLTELGCTIHSFEPERNPVCVTYPQDERGIDDFLSKIEILYIRIDGWYLSQTQLKLQCMDGCGTKPVVWEINAPSHEILKQFEERHGDARDKNKMLDTFRSQIKLFKLKKRIRDEERFRLNYAKKLSGAVCVSEPLKTYATQGLGISNSVVIPNGSDPSRFSPEKKRKDIFQGFENYFKVIYSGDSKWPWQGIDLISDLAAIAGSRNHKLLFVVIDSSASETTLVNDNLLVLHRINYADVSSYIASADACLCLYHDFDWSSYGFYLSPLKLFDYMACGKPVIASNLGQISSVIEHVRDGLLTSNDSEDIYDRIVFCLDHKEKARKIGKAAREKIINTYSWSQTAKSTLKFIASLNQNPRT